MVKSRLVHAVIVGAMLGLGGTQVPVRAQANPPYITIPNSGVASGDTVTVSGANFSPGSVVILRLTGPAAEVWSQSFGIDTDGSLSYPVRFNEEGMYKLEVLASDGNPLTMIMVSSARLQ
jgi:hypothetical protein